ncbi:MAG: hypothetical protein ACK5NK_09535 [Niabella sp.]
MLPENSIAMEVSPVFGKDGFFKNIVTHDSFIVFPNLSSCTALLIETASLLCGAHLTLSSGTKKEIPGILKFITNNFNTPATAIYLVGLFDGNIFLYLSDFRGFCSKIYAYKVDTNAGVDVLFIKENGVIKAYQNSGGHSFSYFNGRGKDSILADSSGFKPITMLPI